MAACLLAMRWECCWNEGWAARLHAQRARSRARLVAGCALLPLASSSGRWLPVSVTARMCCTSFKRTYEGACSETEIGISMKEVGACRSRVPSEVRVCS